MTCRLHFAPCKASPASEGAQKSENMPYTLYLSKEDFGAPLQPYYSIIVLYLSHSFRKELLTTTEQT